MPHRILVVDDEKNILTSLQRALTLEGFQVYTAANGMDAIVFCGKEDIDLVMLDVRLPDIDGLEVLRKLKEALPALPVIMMSGHATISTAVEATRRGAHDFIEKPLSVERIVVTIENALKFSRLREENEILQEEMKPRLAIVGTSLSICSLLDRIVRVAPSMGRVLITGENGTGKELVARAIHEHSQRLNQPFIKVNCAAIPKDLIESELFGHERGAFTGAIKSRKGKFELAHGGTIFLDEIGDMPVEMQAKLLRVLQENEFERVGGMSTIKVDVRVIAATNKDIHAEIQAGNFREDLYYRLNVVPLHVPPLRERIDDVPLLADHFLRQSCQENCRPVMRFAPEALDLLLRYPWPGNVRELRNLVERLVILSTGTVVNAEELLGALPQQTSLPDLGAWPADLPLKDIVQEVERKVILERLEANRFQMNKTAADLGLERSHLYKKMKALGLRGAEGK